MQHHPDLFRGKNVVCEDLPITLCLLEKGPFYMMKEELMVYRVLEKSVSHSDTQSGIIKGFSYHVFFQTLILANTFGINVCELKPYVNSVIPNFVYFAYMTKDKDWMRQLQKDIRPFEVKLSFKQWLMSIIIRFDMLNQWMVSLHNLYKRKSS
jgi:hypothetical protein